MTRNQIGIMVVVTAISLASGCVQHARFVQNPDGQGVGYVSIPENTNTFPFYYRDEAKRLIEAKYIKQANGRTSNDVVELARYPEKSDAENKVKQAEHRASPAKIMDPGSDRPKSRVILAYQIRKKNEKKPEGSNQSGNNNGLNGAMTNQIPPAQNGVQQTGYNNMGRNSPNSAPSLAGMSSTQPNAALPPMDAIPGGATNPSRTGNVPYGAPQQPYNTQPMGR